MWIQRLAKDNRVKFVHTLNISVNSQVSCIYFQLIYLLLPDHLPLKLSPLKWSDLLYLIGVWNPRTSRGSRVESRASEFRYRILSVFFMFFRASNISTYNLCSSSCSFQLILIRFHFVHVPDVLPLFITRFRGPEIIFFLLRIQEEVAFSVFFIFLSRFFRFFRIRACES